MKKIALIFALVFSVNTAFANDIIKTENYLPGGKYRMFGAGRGDVSNVANNIHKTSTLSQQTGNLAIETNIYSGHLNYTQTFKHHGWHEHGPFTNTARQEFHSKKGKIVNGSAATIGGATLTDLSVSAYEIHPADAYDGEQGGGYPLPIGARDEYSYAVNGKEVSVRVVNPEQLPKKTSDDKLLKTIGINPQTYEKKPITLATTERNDIRRLTQTPNTANALIINHQLPESLNVANTKTIRFRTSESNHLLSENDNKLYITNPKNNGKTTIKLATTERTNALTNNHQLPENSNVANTKTIRFQTGEPNHLLPQNDNKLYITNPQNNGKTTIKLATTERTDSDRFNNAYQNANNDSTSYNEQPEPPNDLIGEIPTEPYEDFNGSDDVNKNTLPENQNNAPTDGNKNEQPENQNNAPTDGSKNKQPESRNNISSCDNFCIIIPNFGNNDNREDKNKDSNTDKNKDDGADESDDNTDDVSEDKSDDDISEHQDNESQDTSLPENADNDVDTGEVPLPQAESLPQDITKTNDNWLPSLADIVDFFGLGNARSQDSVTTTKRNAALSDLKAIDNLEAAGEISSKEANALRKAAVGKGDDLSSLFNGNTKPNASDLKKYAENQGWTYSRTENGPIKYTDENGVVRITIKQGSSRAPGSAAPHVELRNSSGQRIDPQGNPVTRKSTGNHTPINYDL